MPTVKCDKKYNIIIKTDTIKDIANAGGFQKNIIELIDKNKTITMTELKHKLKEKFKIELSRFHINRIINDNNITLKITRIRHEPGKRFGKEININQKLKEFYDEIKKHKLEDIICIDETSISSLQKRHKCYSKLGKKMCN